MLTRSAPSLPPQCRTERRRETEKVRGVRNGKGKKIGHRSHIYVAGAYDYRTLNRMKARRTGRAGIG